MYLEVQNTILYVGLIMVALGLLLTFVGLEEFFALLRILFCTVPSFLKNCCHRKEDSEKLLDEESIEEEEVLARVKTAVARNGKLKPIRRPVNTIFNKDQIVALNNSLPQQQQQYDHQNHHHDYQQTHHDQQKQHQDHQQHHHDRKQHHYDHQQQPWNIGDDEEPRSRLPKLQSEESSRNIFGGEDPLSYSLSSAFSLRDLQLDIRPGIVQRGNNFFTNKF